VALRKIEDNWLSKLETQLQSSWILGRIGWELLAPAVLAKGDLDGRSAIEAKERGGSDQDEGAQDHCLAQVQQLL
jgi:hypothetical protein